MTELLNHAYTPLVSALCALSFLLLLIAIRLARFGRTNRHWWERRKASQRSARFFGFAILAFLITLAIAIFTGFIRDSVDTILPNRNPTQVVIQPTATPTHTLTATDTPTETTTPTSEPTLNIDATVASILTGTASALPTATETLTPTQTDTPVPTEPVSDTVAVVEPSPTETPTETLTETATLTETPTYTATTTATPTLTETATFTATNTPTETFTPTQTPTPENFFPLTPPPSNLSIMPEAQIEIRSVSENAQQNGEVSTTVPVGSKRIYLFVTYQSMQTDITWSRLLLQNDVPIQGGTYLWRAGESGEGLYFFGDEAGYPAGQYEVQFYLGDLLVERLTFDIVE